MVAALVESFNPPQISLLWGVLGSPGQTAAPGSAPLPDSLPKAVGRISLLGERTFAVGEVQKAGEFLRELKVGTLLRVVSAAQCLTKVINVPELDAATALDQASLANALALIADAEAPGVPWWRRAAGVLPPLNPTARPTAVVSVWPASSDTPSDDFVDWNGGNWVSTPAALAGLGRMLGHVTLAAHANRNAGSFAIVAQGEDRAFVRTTRVVAATDADWARAIDRTVRETVAAAGITHNLKADPDGLTLVYSSENELGSAEAAPRWLGRWGLAVGALAVWGTDQETVRGLATLRRSEPVADVPPLERAIAFFASPRRAAAIIAAGVAAMVLVPMGTAWGRLHILEDRAKVARLTERLGESEMRVGFYELLRERRWPMAKLIADVSGSAPVGIELESLELVQGETVTLRGTAQKPDLVAKFRENLANTKVFSQLATPSVESGSGVRFTLTAKVIGNGALYQGKWAEDFAAEPLGKRLFGPDWQPPEIAHAAIDERPSAQRRRTGDSESSTARRDAAGSRSSSDSAAAFVPPPPLSDADIAKMDKNTAMKEWGARKAAAAKTTDPAIKQRLADEAERAKQRMLQAPAAKPAGGPTP